MNLDLHSGDVRANRSAGMSMRNPIGEIENRWMKATTLSYYRCISCEHQAMTYDSDQSVDREFIRESLRCQNCSAVYQIVDGIPRFVPDDNYAQSFGFQWNAHEKTQLDSYTGRPISEKALVRCNRMAHGPIWTSRSRGWLWCRAIY